MAYYRLQKDIFVDDATGIMYEDQGPVLGMVAIGTNGAAHSFEKAIIGGGRNEATQVNNFTATKHECNSTILNTVTTIQAVSGGVPAYLMGITIHTALAGTLTITGLTNVAGTATPWVIPIGAVGQILPPANARRCEVALSATLSSATDYGRVMIDWRPIS